MRIPERARLWFAVCGLAALVALLIAHGLNQSPYPAFVAIAIFAAFYAASWTTMGETGGRLFVGLQVLVAIVAARWMPHSEGALVALACAQLVLVFGTIPSAVLMVVSVMSLFSALLQSHGVLGAIKAMAECAGFAAFANVGLLLLARVEADRQQIATINAELLRTRRQLAERARKEAELRMQRNVHDHLGHLVASARIQLAQLQATPSLGTSQLAELAATLEVLFNNARDLAQLRAAQSLDEALDDVRKLFSGVHVDVELPGVSAEIHTLIANHLRELVANAVRHALATGIRVQATADDGRTNVTISDNGIRVAQHGSPRPGFGLSAFDRDVRALGGAMSLRASPFQVVVEFPASEPL